MPNDSNNPGSAPPPRPWKKGQQGGYSALTLEVEVCRDEFGRVYSSHQLQDGQDHQTVMSWPGGGQEAVAFALLVEAARREAMLGLLIEMSKDRSFVVSATESTDARRQAIRDLAEVLKIQISRTVDRIAESVVEEAFTLVEVEK